MSIDWEQIKFIFQIPKKWFQDIGNKIDHMYGEGFVSVKENGRNDGIEIGIDHEQFEDEVRRITGTTEYHVSTVDGVGPGSDGNVQLGSVRSINGEYFPDANGNVVIQVGDGRVKTVDGVGPFSDGNVLTNAIKSINHEYYPDSFGDGNVDIDFVKKVDGKEPDQNGNINLGALTTLDIADQGSTAGPSYKGDKPVSPMSHNHNIDEVLGVKNEDGTYNFVKSINTSLKPDSNGNINLNLPDVPAGQFLVASVDGIAPKDEKGDVKLGAVRSIKVGDTAQDILKPDANGQIDLGKIDGSVKTVNDVEPDEDGNIDLGSIVYSVNGVEPDESGDVSLEIEAEDVSGLNTYTTNIVNTKIESHLSPITQKLENLTHNDITDWATATFSFLDVMDVADLGVIAGPNYEGEKYICPANHNHKFEELVDWEDTLNEKYVTLDTTQTITGDKTFTQSILVSSDDGTSNGVQINPQGSIGVHGIGSTTGLTFYNSQGNTMSGFQELIAGTSLYSMGNLILSTYDADDGNVILSAPVNGVGLVNSPSDDCKVENAVATVGWVRKNAGGVKSVDTDYKPDENGNIDLKAVRTEGTQTINGAKTFTNQVYVKNSNGTATYYPHAIYLNRASGGPFINFYPDGGGVAGTIQSTSTNGLYLNVQAGKNLLLSAEAGKAILSNHPGADTTTTSKSIPTVGWCNTYFGRVKSVNGKGPDANGNVTIETGNGTVKSVDGVSPNNQGDVSLGAVRVTEVTTAGSIGRVPSTAYVANAVHMHHWYDIEDLTDFVENVIAISPYAIKQVDGRSPDAYGDINFGLQQNAWVKTDWQGHLTTTTDQPVALPSGTTGQSATITVLTGLSWNGTQLVASRSNLTYTNGVLTGVASASNITINTVAYS